MSKIRKLLVITIGLFIFGAVGYSLGYAALNNKEMADEYMFYKITEGLPSYSTSVDWIFIDRPDLVFSEESRPYYEEMYETPIWVHPPLPHYLSYPFTLITEDVRYLRFVSIALTLGILGLVYFIVRRKLSRLLTLITLMPILLFEGVLAAGGTYFYYEAFMVFFLFLTIYLSERGSRWKYLVATAMVVSKTPAAIFLLPLIIKEKNWKFCLPGLVLVPYYLATVFVSGDFFYLLNHWVGMKVMTHGYWTTGVVPNLTGYIIDSGLIPFLIMTIPGIVLVLRQKQYWLLVLLVITMGLGVGWSWVFYQMLAMLFVGLLVFSYVVGYLEGYYRRNPLRRGKK